MSEPSRSERRRTACSRSLRPLPLQEPPCTPAGPRTAAARDARRPRISLQARNEPVQAVLLRLARESGASITVGQAVSGYVTVSLHGVTLPQALSSRPRSARRDVPRARRRLRRRARPDPSRRHRRGAAGVTPTVLPVTVVPVHRAATQLRALFPQASVREDARSNALLVIASPADVQAMRTVLQGIDVRNPTTPITEALATQTVRADAVATQLHGSFPSARIAIVGTRQLLVTALPQDLAQIQRRAHRPRRTDRNAAARSGRLRGGARDPAPPGRGGPRAHSPSRGPARLGLRQHGGPGRPARRRRRAPRR